MQLFKKILVGILTLESRLILAKYKPFIVAVTGSVGKTSTKDAIYCVLKDQSRLVRKSQKSLNSEIGLPLTVIGVPNAWHNIAGWLGNIFRGLSLIIWRSEYPDCLVLEIGADHPGDIKSIGRWLHPDITVITKISRMPVHVEFFASPEEVFEEKAALAEALKPGGTLVLFADDDKIMSLADRLSKLGKNARTVSYGLSEKSHIRGLSGQMSYDEISHRPVGFSFEMQIGGETIPLLIRDVAGDTYAYPLLAAAAVAEVRNIKAVDIGRRLSSYEPPKGRMNIIEGIRGSILIDDTYNSSPDAASSALLSLKNLNIPSGTAGRKIAVLGDMMELGKYSIDEHRKIGREAVTIVSMLVVVGTRSRMTAEEAQKSGLPAERIRSFENSAEAGEFLTGEVGNGDLVLIKGSQSMRMERVVKVLLKEPAKCHRLLVRQEKEWLEKK